MLLTICVICAICGSNCRFQGHSMRVLVSLRLERSGREESDRVGSRCPVCEEAGNLSPRWGWFSWGDGTQRSRAGLSSDGPPGLGPRLGSGLRGLVSCRWWTSWLNSGEGLNHEPHKGHEKNMGRIGRLGNLGRSATTAMRLVGALGADPGLSSFLGQPWAGGLNAVGVGGAGARGVTHSPCAMGLPMSLGQWGQSRRIDI